MNFAAAKLLNVFAATNIRSCERADLKFRHQCLLSQVQNLWEQLAGTKARNSFVAAKADFVATTNSTQSCQCSRKSKDVAAK